MFSELDFAGRVEDAPLLEAVTFLQTLLRQGQSPRQTAPSAFPTAFIPKGVQRYLCSGTAKQKRLEVDRYEFLVYRLLRNALEAGDVFVRDSTEFRPFEDDLISDTPLAAQGRGAARDRCAHLAGADPRDSGGVSRDPGRQVHRGESAHRRRPEHPYQGHRDCGRKRRWTLRLSQSEEPVNSPFYSQLPGIGIADLLWFVAANTGLSGTFRHVLDRYVKRRPDPRNSRLHRGHGDQHGAGENGGGLRSQLRVDADDGAQLPAAGNPARRQRCHHNAMAALPAFHLYDIQDTMHSSSDGQRMETQIDTINARYSPKYFGLHQGVSAYTLVANHVPINAKIIGTHEHESHYVFDLLYNNTSDIKPERHSTDTHGTNQVNFWILHVFGYRFAPRYRDLQKRIATLVGFQHPNHYGDSLIKPSRKACDALIIKEWPNIQRIMASLAQKDVTQATIVRKLSSYARQNQTKKALWELDNLCRTLYILDFIDDVDLRQSVQKALNRGEAYHRFRRAVAYVNGGKFRVKTEAEQQIWNECSRLITNAVIYYNTALLSRVYEQKRAAGDREAMAIIAGISPVAWQHVNLIGAIEFSRSRTGVNLDALVARYADPDCWRKALEEEEAA